MPSALAPTTVRSNAPDALASLGLALESELRDLGAVRRQVVFACIGSDRSTGDALGPLVGQRLRALGHSESEVIGTIEEPLHALNLAERMLPCLAERPAPLIVAVDAALGAPRAVGTVRVRRGGLRPGEGLGKQLPEIGELAVAATVNVRAGARDAHVLQCTRLHVVQNLAELVAGACWWSLRNLRRDALAQARPGVEAVA